MQEGVQHTTKPCTGAGRHAVGQGAYMSGARTRPAGRVSSVKTCILEEKSGLCKNEQTARWDGWCCRQKSPRTLCGRDLIMKCAKLQPWACASRAPGAPRPRPASGEMRGRTRAQERVGLGLADAADVRGVQAGEVQLEEHNADGGAATQQQQPWEGGIQGTENELRAAVRESLIVTVAPSPKRAVAWGEGRRRRP
jgi:hypothetical protein